MSGAGFQIGRVEWEKFAVRESDRPKLARTLDSTLPGADAHFVWALDRVLVDGVLCRRVTRCNEAGRWVELLDEVGAREAAERGDRCFAQRLVSGVDVELVWRSGHGPLASRESCWLCEELLVPLVDWEAE